MTLLVFGTFLDNRGYSMGRILQPLSNTCHDRRNSRTLDERDKIYKVNQPDTQAFMVCLYFNRRVICGDGY